MTPPAMPLSLRLSKILPPSFLRNSVGLSSWRINNAIKGSRCVLCQIVGSALCSPCQADIRRLSSSILCPICAASTGSEGRCGECLKKPPFFDRTLTAQIYQPPLSFLIRLFKYGNGWQLAPLLAEFLPPPPVVDAVLAVPLFPSRERWRGFNQSRELARVVFGAPLADEERLLRVADTAPQVNQLSAAARRKNVRRAFQASKTLSGMSVLVVDDVMSSGSTLNEIAKTLKNAGVKSVTNLVVARAA